ncbi:DEAD-box type RNA helicase [Physocladia obscura]|uniref:DEAD-box type RNA helicase n=1 Tax=Physocladia obscura TaxID=109957 RepID=A0AAD5T7X7_9FUNG|nr:DEAD-box type RNA helicase [Physocladia obscura]
MALASKERGEKEKEKAKTGDKGKKADNEPCGFDELLVLPKHVLLHPQCLWLNANPSVAAADSTRVNALATSSSGSSHRSRAHVRTTYFQPLFRANLQSIQTGMTYSTTRHQPDPGTAKARQFKRTQHYRSFINSNSSAARASSCPVFVIPNRFSSVFGHDSAWAFYLSCFRVPLLEENRAQIAEKANLYDDKTLPRFRPVDVIQWGATIKKDSKNSNDPSSSNSKDLPRRPKSSEKLNDFNDSYYREETFENEYYENDNSIDPSEQISKTDYSHVRITVGYGKDLKPGDILLISEFDLSNPSVLDEIYFSAVTNRSSCRIISQFESLDDNYLHYTAESNSCDASITPEFSATRSRLDELQEQKPEYSIENPIIDKIGILRVLSVSQESSDNNDENDYIAGNLKKSWGSKTHQAGGGHLNIGSATAYCKVSQMPEPTNGIPTRTYISDDLGTAIPLDRVYLSLSDNNPNRLSTDHLKRAILDGKFDYERQIADASISGKKIEGLNPSQQKAHDAALATVKYSGVCLIQGPPGNPTNTAMIQVATRLVAELRDNKLLSSRTRAEQGSGDFKFDPCILVVLGHREKIEDLCDPEFRQFCLEIRVEMVAKCVYKFACAVGDASASNFFGGDSGGGDYGDYGGRTQQWQPEQSQKQRQGKKKGGNNKGKQRSDPHYSSSSNPIRANDIRETKQIQNIYDAVSNYSNEMKNLVGQTVLSVDLSLIEPFDSVNKFVQLAAKHRSESSSVKYDSNNSSYDATSPSSIIASAQGIKEAVQKIVSFDSKGNLDRGSKTKRQFAIDLQELFIKKAQAIFSTLNGTYSSNLKDNDTFNVVIVDEAGQATEAETTCVMRECVRALILVGDIKQLESTIISEACRTAKFGRSLAERLVSLKHPVFMLETQYRMHPQIAEFCSSQIYNGWLMNSDWVHNYNRPWYENPEYSVVQFVAHSGTRHMRDSSGSSSNDLEAKLICTRLSQFLGEYADPNLSIGIICPYKAQKVLLESLLLTALPQYRSQINVNTVDGFQGQERDLIILSLTRVDHVSGFLDDLRRVNVALSRARYNMWVYGDYRTYYNSLGQFGSFGWFFDHCDQRGFVKRVNAIEATNTSSYYETDWAADYLPVVVDSNGGGGRRRKNNTQNAGTIGALVDTEESLLDAWAAAF